jgi:hypothetical protein
VHGTGLDDRVLPVKASQVLTRNVLHHMGVARPTDRIRAGGPVSASTIAANKRR